MAVGYLRRSTDRQKQPIPDRRKAIERYAAQHDFELARFFVDDAISGTSAVRRPAFQEMVGLAQQERRPFSYVIVYGVKRFGRLGNEEARHYRHIIRTQGVEVLYVCENFSGDATDDLLRTVMFGSNGETTQWPAATRAGHPRRTSAWPRSSSRPRPARSPPEAPRPGSSR